MGARSRGSGRAEADGKRLLDGTGIHAKHGRARREVVGELAAVAGVESEEVRQARRAGGDRAGGHREEPRTGAVPALGDADELAAGQRDLTRPEPGETDDPAVPTGYERPLVDGRPGDAGVVEGAGPQLAEPPGGTRHVGLEAPVTGRYEDVEPHLLAGPDEDGPAAAAAADHRNAGSGARAGIDGVVALGAAEHDGAAVGSDEDGAPPGRGRGHDERRRVAVPLAEEEGAARRDGRRGAQSPAARSSTGMTYGSHSWRTSPPATSSHTRERGARGGRASTSPESSSR